MGNTDKFDSIASNYDNPERTHIAKVASDAIKEHLGDTRSKSAIDFGCGTGLVGMNLVSEFESLLLMDTSENMLDIVKKKITDVGALNARTLCFDFESSSQPDLRADYIFMAQVLLHIQDYEAVLAKLHAVLNDEGHLLIVDFNKNDKVVSELVHNGFDQEQLKALMLKIGFKDIRSKTIYSGTKLFMNQDASLFIMDGKK